MKVIYSVIFTETKNSVLVYIPALKGMTEGENIADAVEMARDYIANALFDRQTEDIPEQTDAAEIKDSPFYSEGKTFTSLVDVNLDYFRMIEKSKTVRRNITLPEWLDTMAEKAHLNVSEIARNALKEALCV